MTISADSKFALGTFSTVEHPPFAGLVLDGGIAPIHVLKPVFEDLRIAPLDSSSVLQLLEGWDKSYAALQETADFLSEAASSERWRSLFLPPEQVRFHPPVDLPRQIFCAGANYRKHVIDLMVDQAAGPDSAVSRDERRARATKLMDDRAAHGAPFAFSKTTLRLAPNQAVSENLPPVLAETIPHLPQLHAERSLAVICSGSACQPPVFTTDELQSALQAALRSN